MAETSRTERSVATRADDHSWKGRIDTAVSRLRNPAYTGANRCFPCTGVNLGLTAVAALAVGTISPPAGALVGVGGLLAVWLRGYVVPGTPELTKRYLPDRVLAWFDKAPDGDALGGIDPEAYLRAAGAITDGPDGDIVVTPATRAALIDGVAALDSDDRLARALADTLSLDPADVTVRPEGVGYAARVGGQPGGRWESRLALATDLAVHDLFADRVGGWLALPADTRASLLGAFRLSLDSCPGCDGHVTLGSDTAESCCRAYDVLVASCESCGSRLFEVDAALAGGDVAA
ncbi:hypothetical protein B4589_005185 [Halolamina sp. CBA1230]|uniref:hypothetical protein n=1 Tax=Halolamina sp. CBA1230 TaxID=1853690 RepID=UPI0009A14964|nr:hypothetical protein [Halolamina sp. CBA1230]QKY19801.1 hypothetical protein B4589_005185 [Halolamina sp. CBA1230]